jgi:hypothetical protein
MTNADQEELLKLKINDKKYKINLLKRILNKIHIFLENKNTKTESENLLDLEKKLKIYNNVNKTKS